MKRRNFIGLFTGGVVSALTLKPQNVFTTKAQMREVLPRPVVVDTGDDSYGRHVLPVYVGLLDKYMKEIKGRGYKRVKATATSEFWGLYNLREVVFYESQGYWGEVHNIAIFRNAREKQPAFIAGVTLPKTIENNTVVHVEGITINLS